MGGDEMSEPKGLRPYQEDATCPKCGGGAVSAWWAADVHHVDCPLNKRHTRGSDCEHEHICRRCLRCKYQWAEAPIAASEVTE